MCLNPHNKIYTDPLSGIKKELVYPCGKCPDCVVSKQRAQAALSILEAQKQKMPIYFFTFTYDNSHIPLYKTVYTSNDVILEQRFVTDEEDKLVRPHCISNSGVVDSEEYFPSDNNRYNRAIQYFTHERYTTKWSDGEVCSDSDQYVVYTPSINNQDLKNCIKKFRESNRYHSRTTKFSYSAVGEYGDKSMRPHFHAIFYNITPEEAHILSTLWTFGSVNYTQCKTSPEDILRSSLYTAKYINKGCYECDWLKTKRCQRPHRLTSQGFGIDKSKLNSMLSYFACYDLYGKYDLDTLQLSSGIKMTYSMQCNILEEMGRRRQLTLYGQTFPIPDKIKKILFYHKLVREGEDGVKHIYYRPCRIYNSFLKSVAKKQDEIMLQELFSLGLKEDYSNYGRTVNLYEKQLSDMRNAKYRDKMRKHYSMVKICKTIND